MLVASSRVPLRSILKSVKGILVLLLLTVILNIFFTKTGTLLCKWWIFEIYDGGLYFAAKMFLRLTYLVVGSSVLTLTTTPVDLTHAIESLLKPLKVIKVPESGTDSESKTAKYEWFVLSSACKSGMSHAPPSGGYAGISLFIRNHKGSICKSGSVIHDGQIAKRFGISKRREQNK